MVTVFIILKKFKVSSSQWKPWQLYHRSLVQSAAAYRDWILQMSLLGRKHLEEQTMETESGAICETETKPENRNFSENSDDRTKKPKKIVSRRDNVPDDEAPSDAPPVLQQICENQVPRLLDPQP